MLSYHGIHLYWGTCSCKREGTLIFSQEGINRHSRVLAGKDCIAQVSLSDSDVIINSDVILPKYGIKTLSVLKFLHTHIGHWRVNTVSHDSSGRTCLGLFYLNWESENVNVKPELYNCWYFIDSISDNWGQLLKQLIEELKDHCCCYRVYCSLWPDSHISKELNKAFFKCHTLSCFLPAKYLPRAKQHEAPPTYFWLCQPLWLISVDHGISGWLSATLNPVMTVPDPHHQT